MKTEWYVILFLAAALVIIAIGITLTQTEETHHTCLHGVGQGEWSACRIFDEEAGVYCWYKIDSGVDCLPCQDTRSGCE